MEKIWEEMYDAAKAVLNPRRISEYVTAGEVADLVPDVDLSDYYTKAEHDDTIEALSELYSPINHTHSEYMLKGEAGTFKVSELTETEYNNIWDKDPNTLYILREG